MLRESRRRHDFTRGSKLADVAALSAAQEPRRERVGEAKDVTQDAGGSAGVPEDGANLVAGEAFVAQLSEDAGCQDHHGATETSETAFAAKGGHIDLKRHPESDPKLGQEEKDAEQDMKDQEDVRKDDPGVGKLGGDDEEDGRNGNGGENDGIADADDVEEHVLPAEPPEI